MNCVIRTNKYAFVLTVLLACIFSTGVYSQGNGKLQLHFIDVDQGDGAILISPNGETVLFDNGDWQSCSKPLNYLRSLGITKIDHMIISHFHSDHFGCTREVVAEFPLQGFSYDRPGATNKPMFTRYANAVGSRRKNVTRRTSIVLDAQSQHPVRINIAGYNGAGVPPKSENDRSVVAVIHFGSFNAMMAGDLSGYVSSYYNDIETKVAGRVGQVEVYKVNHHGSRYSSNPRWMKRLSPRVAIISAGAPNSHGHPNSEALQRIHNAGTEAVYWTSAGDGAAPVSGKDFIANGSIIIEVVPGADVFTVSYPGITVTHNMWPIPYKGRR